MLGHEAAVAQLEASVAEGRDFLRVGHDEERYAVVLVQLLEQRQHFTAGHGIEGARGLVGQDQPRFGDEGTGDGHALLLTTGEHHGQRHGAVAHLQPLKQGERLALGDAGPHALVDERLRDVIAGVEVVEQVSFLEDEGDRLLTELDQLLAGQAGHVAAVEADGARAGLHQAAKALHEGRFS